MKTLLNHFTLFCIIIVLSLTGCGNKEQDQTLDVKICRDIVENFLNDYSAQKETCGEYLYMPDDDTNISFNGFQSYLASSIDYEIKTAAKTEDGYSVEVIIKNTDFSDVVEKLSKKIDLVNSKKESIRAVLASSLTDPKAPKRTFKVTIHLDDNKKIVLDSDLSNALLGGFNEFLYNITEGSLNEKNN